LSPKNSIAMEIFEFTVEKLSMEELIQYVKLTYINIINEKGLAKRITIVLLLQKLDEIIKNKNDSMAYTFDEIQ